MSSADNVNASKTPSAGSGCLTAEESSRPYTIASASTKPTAGKSYSNEWHWAREKTEDGTVEEKWVTVNPRGKKVNVITVLLNLDRETGISIMVAFPELLDRSTNPAPYWAKASNRSHVKDLVETIMNTLNLSACLHESIMRKSRARNTEEFKEEEEFLIKAANTLTEKFKLNEPSAVGENRVSHNVVFRQASAWDNIVAGEHHVNQKTLFRDWSTRRHALPPAQGNQIFEKISSLGDGDDLRMREHAGGH